MKNILNSLSLSIVLGLSLTAASAATLPKAEKLNKQQLQSLIASAKTPAEHERIAQYYEAKAQNDLVQANEHAQMAVQFKQNAVTSSPKWATGTLNHCEYLAQSLTKDAATMQDLARQHQQMALRAGGR
jgi:hypothetical protein